LDALQGFVEGGPQADSQGLSQGSLHSQSPSTRFGELLLLLPQLQSAAELLLRSKMFYVPFLLNSLTLPDEEEKPSTEAQKNAQSSVPSSLSRSPLLHPSLSVPDDISIQDDQNGVHADEAPVTMETSEDTSLDLRVNSDELKVESPNCPHSEEVTPREAKDSAPPQAVGASTESNRLRQILMGPKEMWPKMSEAESGGHMKSVHN
jgi:hypothetical protein